MQTEKRSFFFTDDDIQMNDLKVEYERKLVFIVTV